MVIVKYNGGPYIICCGLNSEGRAYFDETFERDLATRLGKDCATSLKNYFEAQFDTPMVIENV